MIEYTALQNAPSTASLVRLEDVNILIDPGCDDMLRCDLGRSLKPDLILLCHSTLAHLGGYVYGYKHYGWSAIPVYSTLPTINMGRMTLFDAYKSVLPEYYNLQDIDNAFDHINTLRYAQATQLSGKCQGIELSAYNAGHTLGGTI